MVLSQNEFTYDGDGNVILSIDRERFDNDSTSSTGSLGSPSSGIGARASYVADYYDAADRLTAEANVGTNGGASYTRPSTAPSSTDTDLVTTIGYDAAGNASDITDPRNIITHYDFDMLSRKTMEYDAYVHVTGLPATGSAITGWTYDGDDNVLTMTAYGASPAQTTAYVRGVGSSGGLFSNDLIAKIEYPTKCGGSAGSPDTTSGGSVSYNYDLLGEPISATDQNGNVHTLTYDILGRMTLDAVTTLGSGVDGAVRALGYSFNALGLPYQQTSYSDSSASTVVNQVQDAYNGYGQLTTEYQAHSGTVSTSSTPVTQYTYSQPSGANYSRLSSITYPSGRVLHYGYDNSGIDNNISRVDYLADDNPASGQAVGIHLQDYTYLGLDTIVQRTDGNGIALTYIKQGSESNGDAGDQYTGLDRFGRIVDQRWIPASNPSSPTDRFKYAYDRDSNVLYKNNLVNSSFSELYHANSSSSNDNGTAYDKLNRLTGFRRGTLSPSGNNGSGVLDTVSTLNTLSNSQQSFTLDAVGNQTSVTTDGTATSRNVNSQNQITALGSTSLAYDNNGNTTTDDQGHTLIYDAWNRQVQVKNGAMVLTTYGFDADGRRIIESPGGTANDLYFSSAGQVLEERQSGTIVNQNVWGLGYVNDLVLRDHFTSAGALDTSFGSGGKVTTTVNTNATAWRDIIQPDGKIVAIGASNSGGEVVRYNADGSLDSSFGTGGIVTISAGWLIDGAIQSDGKIVAVGGSGGDFFIIRLNTDGTSDTSFNSSGSTQVDFGASEYAMGVALAPDGKIVVTGPTITGGSGDFAVVRLTTSGALDTSFNSTGKETLDLGDNDGPSGVLVQDTGKIVIVGQSGNGAYVVRFNAAGGLDTSFGPSGTGKLYLYGDYAFRMNIEALSDNRLLVTGNEDSYLVLHRYSADGIVDSTFGTSGVVTTNLGGGRDWGYDVGVQPDGKVITVGADYNGGADGAVVRYNVDGSLDTSFGTGGKMLIWYGSSSYSETDYFESVAIQPDGQIVAVGTANGKFALARMNGGLTRLYAQHDAIESVTAVVDVSGNVKERFIYTPYGSATVLSPSWSTTSDSYTWSYRFQGTRFDPVADKARMGVRDLALDSFTWDQADPTGAAYVNGANLYQFVLSNPSTFADPSGLQAVAEPAPPEVAPEVRPGENGPGGALNLPSSYPAVNPNWAPVVGPTGIPVTPNHDDLYGKPPPGYVWDPAPYVFDPLMGDSGPQTVLSPAMEAAISAADAKLQAKIAAIKAKKAQAAGGNGGAPPCDDGTSDPCDDLMDQAYGMYENVKGSLPGGWQAHHVLQNAMAKPIIPKNLGPAVGLPGNILTQPQSPHGIFHSYMERFWSPFRKNSGSPLAGKKPTWNNYDNAIRDAFATAGCSPDLVEALIEWAKAYRRAFGIRDNSQVPRVPGPIGGLGFGP